MRNVKRITSLLLTILLIVSIMPATLATVAFASDDFVDFPTGWSAEAMQAAVDNGLMNGRGDNRIEPKALLTRAEAVAIINRAFGATVKANISSFTDVSRNDWYYDEFAKAVNMNTIVGDGNGLIRPTANITRQEIFTVIARALVLSENDKTLLDGFSDADTVASWAMPYVCAMVKNGYVNGNPNGTIRANECITREEFAQMMHNIFKTYISKAGTVTTVGADSVMIRTGGVTLKNVTIEKDLVLGDGVGAGDVILENVKIKGRLLCRGGEGSVKLTNTTVGDRVVVNDVNGTVNFANYETETPFKNAYLITKATFLQKQNTTSGGSSGGGQNQPESRAILTFDPNVAGDDITVNITLSKMPKDLTDLAAITIPYEYDASKLDYVDTVTTLGGTQAATAGNISWFTASPVSSDELTAKGNVLFTIKFTKKPTATGIALFTFGAVEIADSAYTESSMYIKKDAQINFELCTVKVYKGTANYASNLKGKIENIPVNTTITQSQIDNILGTNWAVDNRKTAFTDSYGNVHYVYPDLWYNDGTSWKLFDVTKPITSDLAVCMLNSSIQITLSSDATIGGHSEPTISVEIPYDVNSSIGDSVLTGMTKFGKKLDTYLNELESEGIDIYASAMEKLSAKGLTDSDGNVLLQKITIKLSDIADDSTIDNAIKENLKDSLSNDEIVASILENKAIVDEIMADEDIKVAIMDDDLYKDLIAKDSFKKTLAEKYNESGFEDFKTEISTKLLELGITDADAVVSAYVSGSLDETSKGKVDTAIEDYALSIPSAYKTSLTPAVKAFIDSQIDEFGRATIADFIGNVGTSRDDFRGIINDNADTIIKNCTETTVYSDLVNCFKTGSDINVNKDNYTLVRALATALDSYTGDKIIDAFAGSKADSFIELFGEDTFKRYMESAIDSFVAAANTACDAMEQDVESDPASTNEYPCAAKFSVNVDLVGDILYYNYNKNKELFKADIEAAPAIKYNENTKLQALMAVNPFDALFDTVTPEGNKSGYKFKSDIMAAYNEILNDAILAHDALVWYNKLTEAEITEAKNATAPILAVHANDFNAKMMNFINNNELPGGMKLDQLLSYNADLKALYDENKGTIDKALDKYAKYLDRDYTEVFNKVMSSKASDIIIEKEIRNVDDVFAVLLADGSFSSYPEIVELINKFKTSAYTPGAADFRYYVDAYEIKKGPFNLLGKDLGKLTVDISRYLQ